MRRESIGRGSYPVWHQLSRAARVAAGRRGLRQEAGYKFTPLIALTTENQMSKMEEGKAAGATGWIVKPFVAEKLLAVVKKVTG